MIEISLGIVALSVITMAIFAELPIIALGVWGLVALATWRSAAALDAAARYRDRPSSIVEVIPVMCGVQLVLNRLVPQLGSAFVLFGYLAVLSAIVRDSPFPTARVLRPTRP